MVGGAQFQYELNWLVCWCNGWGRLGLWSTVLVIGYRYSRHTCGLPFNVHSLVHVGTSISSVAHKLASEIYLVEWVVLSDVLNLSSELPAQYQMSVHLHPTPRYVRTDDRNAACDAYEPIVYS